MDEEDADRKPVETVCRSEREDVLGARYRRYALYCLYDDSNPMRLPEIADRITEWEYRVPPEERLDERLQIYMALYHDHLPVLEAADLVRYCQAEDTVALTERAAELEAAVRHRVNEILDS